MRVLALGSFSFTLLLLLLKDKGPKPQACHKTVK